MSTRDDNEFAHDWALPEAATESVAIQPALTVWEGSMPESNGKSNFTAILMRKGAPIFDTNTMNIATSEYSDRVRYEADCVRYLIGELADEPDILAYDADKHSGYVAPAATSVTSAPSEQPTVAAGQSIADDAGYQHIMDELCIGELNRRTLAKWFDAILAARSPVSGQAGEAARHAALEEAAVMSEGMSSHGQFIADEIRALKSTAHPDLCQACNHVHKSPDCAPEDRDAVREAVSGEFPPLPPMDHIADIPNVCRVVSYSPKAMTAYAQACVLADRGIRGKASDAEDGKTDPTLDIVAWYYEVDDGDGEGFQPWTNAKRPDDDNDYVRNIRPLVFAPLAARAQQQGADT